MDVVDPVLVSLDILYDVLAHTDRVPEVHAATYAQRWVLDHLDDLLDVGERGPVGSMGVDGYLDAGLGHFLYGVVQQFVLGYTDEHVRTVTLGIGESAVDLGLAVHVYRAENIALDSVFRTFGLEGVHLLFSGVERKPEILYRQILDTQALEIFERLVDGETAIGVAGDAYLEVVGTTLSGDQLRLGGVCDGNHQAHGQKLKDPFHENRG